MNSKLRITPLGGLGEIGKNMTVFEYEDEIIIVDAGVMFPENDMLGIDLIIPDYNYLMDKTDKVKAILITHGHEDHIGALPHLMRHIEAPIYATPLTAGLIDVKMRQAKLANDVELIIFEADDVLQIGQFQVEPFHVAHSIPDCVGFGITTPVGLVVHTGDYKFDHTPTDNWPPDFAKLAEFSERGVLCLLADSTNADRPGWTPSEKVVEEAFDKLFREAKGRIIVATFASLISRIQQVADMAQRYGRKLAITGRSMRDNTKIARKLGYLDVPDDLLIDIGQIDSYPAHEIAIIATGTQGEPSAVMGRLALGRHRNLTIMEGDTVVFSAYAIPGNEEMVYRIINRLFQRGANVLYERIAKVHVSGHASQEEMKLLINLVRPKFLIPIHGELRHLKQHKALAKQLGIPAENIAVVENGTPLELDENGLTIGERLPGGYVFIDGAGVGEVGWSVVRDRDKLAQNGFFVAYVNAHNGNVIGQPDIVTRGIIDMREAEDLLEGARETIARVVKTYATSNKALDKPIEEALERYLYAETGKRPFVQVIVK
ncbi:MAG: ribonuclease J [Ardenticatenaceae bacterium]|nr:ribonuclease J [Ardenticatenaceae bacterium]MCB9446251.1 ribonuclease J [Ardenticatenaceae bacterium]